jgi:F0F1-type ATP synthase assembly protein I
MVKKKSQGNKLKQGGKSLSDYAKYSNLAFKWIAIILIGFFGGMKLDHWLNLNFPIFTLVLATTGLFLSLYLLIKELGK